MSIEKPSRKKSAPAELPDAALEKVSGGTDTTTNTGPTNDTQTSASIGSQSTGAGAGKVTFNPFSITRKIT